jgi:hypothetical protein
LVLLMLPAALQADDRATGIGFSEVAAAVGLTFEHVSPFTPQRHTHLTMGSGLAWIDVDRDAYPDLYCCQGHRFSPPDGPQRDVADQLFRNHRGKFHFAADAVRDACREYSMGAAVADFNADGFDDLFVSCFGPDHLYLNNGDGTLTHVDSVNFPADEFGAGCSWLDVDGDGLLDLFVANYLQLDINDYQLCQATHLGQTIYITCHPRRVPAQRDRVFRNLGDGRFEDWAAAAGLIDQPAKQGLGVAAIDVDRDFDTDIYVANDSVENHLWSNDGQGHLMENGFVTGTALNRSGQREAGMGLTIADIDANGYLDLFVTNFHSETNTLYRNEGGLFFLDVTDELGLAEPGRVRLGFGTSFLDADNDGWSDLFIANGHVHDRLLEIGRGEAFAQKALFLKNQNGRRFTDLSIESGKYFQTDVVGRGCSVADFDRDGRQDIAIQHLNGPVGLLQNQTVEPGEYLSIELVGSNGNRSAIGAILDVTTGTTTRAVPRVSNSSYLSADEGTLHIGLGPHQHAEVVVRWPYGKAESFGRLDSKRHHVLIQGRGTPVRGGQP